MKLQMRNAILIAAVSVTGCSLGPHLQTALPQVRDVPVLAGLSPNESLVRGRTFLASKQYGLAIELFKTASRDPALAADSFNGLAVAYDGIGRSDLAERYFQRALASRPDDQRTRRNLAAFYANSGQEDKRRQLLAGATPVAPRITVDAASTVEEGPVLANLPASLPPVQFAAVPALQTRSPLGAAFRPLLAGALVPSSPAPAAVSGEVSIVCSKKDGAPAGEGPMTIFRISIGEVFITAQPAGSNCVVEGATVPETVAATSAPMGNKEYLGLVAAYLDRLNAMQAAADVSLSWRAAFWSRGDQA